MTGGWRAARALCAAMMVAWVTGCGLLPDVKDETASWSADKLYTNAHDALLEGNYTRAIKLFETLESRYPYGRYAQQALHPVAARDAQRLIEARRGRRVVHRSGCRGAAGGAETRRQRAANRTRGEHPQNAATAPVEHNGHVG